MKKLLSSIFIMFALVTMSACNDKNENSKFTAGTYEETVKGYGGDITVKVTLTSEMIEKIEIAAVNETPSIGTIAVEKLPVLIVEKQTPFVDAVTGATITSDAIITGVKNAIVKSGASLDIFENQGGTDGDKVKETLNTSVVVVGAGGAGMASAIAAKQQGTEVIIIDKMPFVGGNTTRATGGMNVALSEKQVELGIKDSTDLFYQDTMKGGKNINDPKLVEVLVGKSNESLLWLETLGANLPVVGAFGGASVNRIHKPEGGSAVGPYLVKTFEDQIKDLGIELYLDTEATSIIMKDGKAVGVMAKSGNKEYTINADAVIIATGGFGANEEMFVSYNSALKGFINTNTSAATGDGILMAEKAGAALVDMKEIQTHPTVEQETKAMITEGVRGDGAILVNTKGERFTAELGTRDVVSAAILEQENDYSYLIFDNDLRAGQKAIESYVKKGLTTEAASLEELAKKMGFDEKTFLSTVADWNNVVSGDKKDDFGRTTGMKHDITTGPFYAIKVAPGVHHTMGGVKINTNAEVLNGNGEVIEGLFAAGEVTGGVHGANRLGGNAVTDVVVFGKIAGESASAYVAK